MCAAARPATAPGCANHRCTAPRCKPRSFLTLGVNEVDDGVILEDVHLLNARDSVHAQALQGVLQPLVVSGGRLVDGLLLPAFHDSNARMNVCGLALLGTSRLVGTSMRTSSRHTHRDPGGAQGRGNNDPPPHGALSAGADGTGHLH